MKKLLILMSCLLTGYLANSQNNQDSIFTEVDQMPVFNGCNGSSMDVYERQQCSDKELIRYINRFLEYPESARDSGITGTVYVSFVVNENGRVNQAEILKDIGGGCGKAALELLLSMPIWEPAHHEGRKVKMRLNLPISFNLKTNSTEPDEAFTLSWGGLSSAEVLQEEVVSSIKQPLIIRNIKGESLPVNEWTVTCKKGKKVNSSKNRGTVSLETIKLMKNTKPGTIISINATTQENGRFVNVSRSFKVIKPQ
jgi:TonB family protein